MNEETVALFRKIDEVIALTGLPYKEVNDWIIFTDSLSKDAKTIAHELMAAKN